jgi:23S rRNA pseudouridine1911/1915/1917 synthase
VLHVEADRPDERLDVAVARLCDISRAQAQRLIDEGLVVQNYKPRRKAGERLEGGEQLVVTVPAAVEAEPQPEAIPLDIIYEDEHMVVVNKPAGMAVHPGPGHSGRTLVNALLAHCPNLPGIGGVQRPGIVHRLDMDTSGLIIVAKDEKTHVRLSAQIKDHEVQKTYLALVEGRVELPEALIDAPIGRDPNNRQRMMVLGASAGSKHSREAQTQYRVRDYFEGYTLVEATLLTGRTHQIRVHFASIDHPIVGDQVYGRHAAGKQDLPVKLPRQFLHAYRLALLHPIDGHELSFEAPLPSDLQGVLRQLTPASKAGR